MITGENAPADAAALRAEHDALGQKLAARRSIDELRRALYLVFVGLICVGLTIKLAWDRWGVLKPGVVRKPVVGRPLFFWTATAVTLVVLAIGIASLVRARRLAREEDRLFVRFRELRGKLGLES